MVVLITIQTMTQSMLTVAEVIKVKMLGRKYLKGWHLIDAFQLVIFWWVFYERVHLLKNLSNEEVYEERKEEH